MKLIIKKAGFARLISTVLVVWLVFSPAYAKVMIEKSPSDYRQYDYLVLENKLRVVVVSDKSAEKSAATLAVLAGSYDEPADKPGLAHFLEHMIIMGSKKYPHPGNFNTFVSDHGGGRNAMTAQDRTTFFYDVNPAYFQESLERFSDHFVHPLFDANYIEKEIKAVDAEFQMHRDDDFYRGYYVLKNIINPAHPMHRFTSGNLESLWPKDKQGAIELRKRFMDFYDSYYSADKMVLVLVGPQSTNDLAKWAKKYFSDIPLVQSNKVLNTPAPIAFRDGVETQKNIIIHPLKPFYSISMAFPIQSQKKNYQTQPLMYLEVLFSNQAENGLIHQLKQKGWILGMTPNRYEISKEEELYALNFSLTESGLSHVDDIIQACYQYIDVIKQSGLPSWLYDEIKKIDQINFQHVENMPASSLSNYLAQNLHDYPPEKILSYAYLDPKVTMPKQAIQQLLDRLIPEKMILFAFMPGEKQNKKEPYYQVPYYTEPFSPQQIGVWKSPEGALTKPIALLSPNRFLPSNLKIKHVPKYVQPKLSHSTYNQQIWYQPDTEFNMPRIDTHIALHTPYIYESPENLLLARLFVSLASEEMVKLASELGLAGAGISYDVIETGIGIHVTGYSDLKPYEKIVEQSIDALRNLKIVPARFEIQKEALLKVYKAKEQASPIENYNQEIGVLFLKRKMPASTMIALLNKLQAKDLAHFQNHFFKNVALEMLMSGNLTKSEAKNLSKNTINLLKIPVDISPDEQKYRLAELSPILSLPVKGQLLTLKHQHPDNLVVMYLQMKDKHVDTIAKTYLTDYLIKTKFFDELRTESQFGYIVFSQSLVLRDLPGLMFFIQSPKHDHVKIYNKMDEFFHDYDKTLTNMQPNAFEQAKKSLVADMLEKPKSLGEKSARYWSEIVDRTYRFNRAEELAKAVDNITQRELLSFYHEILLNAKRKELTVFGINNQKQANESASHTKTLLAVIKDKMIFKNNSEYIR
jgi:insulysin